MFCSGNETQLNRCEHDHWGRHNCDHNEDVGVKCSVGSVSAEHEVIIRTRRAQLNKKFLF